jgi:hypothetical protein
VARHSRISAPRASRWLAERSHADDLSRSHPTAGRSVPIHRQRAGGTPAPLAARDQLREIGEASARLQLTGSMSAVVIMAQLSMVVDLMERPGLDYHEARELIADRD